MKAFLKNNRQSPRKVRLVADLIKGKTVSEALVQLEFTPKKASETLRKLLESALANAKNTYGAEKDRLIVKEVRVDKGIVLKRSMPRARGSAKPIKKRSSNISLVLVPAEKK